MLHGGAMTISRRGFMGGVATALGYLGIGPNVDLWAQGRRGGAADQGAAALAGRARASVEEYDAFAKISSNENPYGPPESVMKAMTQAFKYANRYGYPDGGIVEALATHHGVKPENIMLGAGSGEVLDVVGTTFLEGGKKVVGVEPSYSAVYMHATSIRAAAITVPLLDDYRQDIPELVKATKRHYRDVGFVYMCNPNNPTGRTVSKQEIRQLLDGIPDDMPVLIDEAYHHFIEDPDYAT